MELADLRETAGLAHLNFSEEDLQNLFPAFEKWISFFAVLPDNDGMLPPSPEQPKDASSIKTVAPSYFRCDTPISATKDASESLLTQAAEHDGRFIVIPIHSPSGAQIIARSAEAATPYREDDNI